MNQIYRIVWNKTLGTWTVASELAKQGKKCGSKWCKAISVPLLLCASRGWALPTGNELVSGSAEVSTPSAGQMHINQSSQKAIINWQGFSIGNNESVKIQQPNTDAALLNRVVGQDASDIQGKLNANGQVYLINPNGVLFSKSAQVDVGGLVASTHAISNGDFLNGIQHFTQGGSTGSVINQGSINSSEEGVVALIGEQVANSGNIVTPKGSTVLAAGKTIDLDMQGDGLVEVKITEAALKAQIDNNGIIQADGGQVVMTAQAAGQLLNTVINNEGVVQARGLVERNGKIVLSGGDTGVVEIGGIVDVSGASADNSDLIGGAINVSGRQIKINDGAKLEASGNAGGGAIVIGDKQSTREVTLQASSSITAQARDHGKAGTIEVLANMDNGTVNVNGHLDASSPKQGDGGFIETSAAHVNVAETTKVITQANHGKTGTWLIDPTDYTIAASGGDITGAILSANLNTSDVIIDSTAGSTGVNGDVNVNDAVNWSVNTLTLVSENNININADLTASGSAKLVMDAGGLWTYADTATITLPEGPNHFSWRMRSLNPSFLDFTVITQLGTENSTSGTDLQGIRGNLSGFYVLGNDIDASETAGWNPVGGEFQGFSPIGDNVTPFTGYFDGLGHTITGLTINRPNDYVGLFGQTEQGAVLSNLTLENSEIKGNNQVGGLVGANSGFIFNVHANGNVSGQNNVGGLAGTNSGTIGFNAWLTSASGTVTGTASNVGGLIGQNVAGTVTNAYAANKVTGFDTVGGLVGLNSASGNISNTYATGDVEGTDLGEGLDSVGGLVGENLGAISGSHAEGSATGTVDVGGLVGFNNEGSISGSYAIGAVNGLNSIGGLVGRNQATITGSYATGGVTGSDTAIIVGEFFIISPENSGGLVGYNVGDITQSFSESNVTGAGKVGGLVGTNTGNISDAYATGNVTGQSVGGLVGHVENGSISNAYATGVVTGSVLAGGLIGSAVSTNTISNVFWDRQSSGQSIGVGSGDSTGVVGKTTAEMMQIATFSNAGWSISDTGGSTAIWRIYQNHTTPLLRIFLTPLMVSADNISKAYDGQANTLSNPVYSPADAPTSGHLFNIDTPYNNAVTAGTYSPDLYSDQLGYDISYINGTLLIRPAELSLSGIRPYDGTVDFNASIFTLSGLVAGEDLTLTGVGSVADKNVGVNKLVNLGSLILGDGSNGLASNYSLTGGTHTATITPAVLTASIVGTPNKTYDGSSIATLTANDFSLSGFVPTEGASVIQTVGTYNSANVADANTVSATLAIGDFAPDAGTQLSNYILPVSATGIGQITTAPLTAIIVGEPTKTYDGSSIATLTANNFSLSGFVTAEGASVTQTVGTYNSANVTEANSVSATLTAGDFTPDAGTQLDNYTLPSTASGTGQITPAPLTAIIVGEPTKTYDGSSIATLTANNFSLSGFVTAEGASVTQTVGIYNSANVTEANSVSASLAVGDFTPDTGTQLDNYTLPSTASGTGQITPAPLTASIVGNPTKIYDGNDVATLAVGNYDLNGFVEGEGASVTQTAGIYNSANVAEVDAVTASLASGDFSANAETRLSNYTLPAFASGVGSIVPAELTITANSDSKTYDGSAYFGGNGVTYSSFVNGEDSNVLMGSLAYGGDSQGAISAGTYDIVPGGFSADNYSITYIDGQLTILSGQDNTAPLVTKVPYQPSNPSPYVPQSSPVAVATSVTDQTAEFVGTSPQYCDSTSLITRPINCQKRLDNSRVVLPTLKVKNSAGGVKRLQMSANNQYLSLLLEDGSVRIWDFKQGDQHQIMPLYESQVFTDIGPVDDEGELVSIASQVGIAAHDVILPTIDERTAIKAPNITQFMTSNDGRLILIGTEGNQLGLWNAKSNKKLWSLPYDRGAVKGLALTDNKHYGAVLSHQSGAYVLPSDLNLKSVTDAVNIIDLKDGNIIKTLPNLGEQILSVQFIDNDTLQLKLANGELLNWSIESNSPNLAGNFAEPVITVDSETKSYAYVNEDGLARVSDGQGQVLLSIQNKSNPFMDAILLDGDNKLLTVMANGELALWDVAAGKKLLRLFSTQQGWTVMDAFGRFDGSEDAMDNFSWSAKDEDIPLDSFSENYYEPGLLSNVMQNQDYLNSNPYMVKAGITLPPRVVLQIAEQQAKDDDSLALKLDVYDRGGGIDKINVYQNGKVLNNDDVIVAEQILQEADAEHRILTLNIRPNAGKNTVKVIASNQMGIENDSTELSFDGKTKAYASSVRLLTIGIDQYNDQNLNLEYSVKDADSVAQTIKNTATVAASKNLYNQHATKAKILAELKEVSQGVQQDILVIYFAGHGLALGKEWYFLPYETQMKSSLEEIAANGITATELSDVFRSSKIQHILLMVDSCYSGAGLDAFRNLQNGQRYFSRRLSRSLGITVMTAATKDQEAFELKSLGHGLFTYLITQELQDKNITQAVTAHGIAESISRKLPVFSKQVLGTSQDPAIYAKGNDFMLTNVLKDLGKNGDSKGSIPGTAQ